MVRCRVSTLRHYFARKVLKRIGFEFNFYSNIRSTSDSVYLIRRLLVLEPHLRLTAFELLDKLTFILEDIVVPAYISDEPLQARPSCLMRNNLLECSRSNRNKSFLRRSFPISITNVRINNEKTRTGGKTHRVNSLRYVRWFTIF